MKIFHVVFILLFLVPSVAAANVPEGSGACCVPAYIANPPSIIFEGVESANDCSSSHVFVESCYANGDFVGGNGDQGCCCDNEDFPLYFGSTVDGGLVTRPFCEVDSSRRFIGAQAGADCSSICSSGVSYFRVSGYVYDQDNQPLEGIVVRAVDSALSVVTNENGFYDFGFNPGIISGVQLFETILPADYDLTCLTDTKQRNINQDSQIDFSLSCEDVPDTCQASWDVGPWSQCYLFNGEYIKSRTVTQTNICADITNKPDVYSSEGCEDLNVVDTCGNGILEGNEQCDIGPSSRAYRVGNTVSSSQPACSTLFGANYNGLVGCTNLCTYDLGSCESGCGSTCEANECGNSACNYICAGSGVCSSCDKPVSFLADFSTQSRDVYDLYDYLSSQDETFGLRYFIGTDDVEIEWSFDEQCSQNVFGVDVMYCVEDGVSNSCATGTKEQFSLIGTTTQSYLFKDILEPETSYCYNVCARTADGLKCAYEGDQLPCFDSGHASCMTPPVSGRDCVYVEPSIGQAGYHPAGCSFYEQDSGEDRRTNLALDAVTCDLNGIAGEAETCIETVYDPDSSDVTRQGAMCAPQVSCSQCNGLLGLYSSYDLPFRSSSCGTLEFSPEIGGAIPGYGGFNTEMSQCYSDRELTPFSFYDSCDQVTSCYDYLTKGTCGQDPCFKFSEVEATNRGTIGGVSLGCSWNELEDVGLETGVGVCVPAQVEQHDCGRCDTDSPLGFCDQTTCDLYGESCYYKSNQKRSTDSDLVPTALRAEPFPSCLAQTEMSCYLYNDETDCSGGSEVEVHVFYSSTSVVEDFLTPQMRIFGTNKQTSFSNDRFGFGDCSWDVSQNVCYKNSNDYTAQLGNQVSFEDDCEGSDSLDCYFDNTPPTTTLTLKDAESVSGELLPVYGALELLDLDFAVEDGERSTLDVETYVSLLPQRCIDQGFVPASCDDNGCSDLPANIEDYYDASCYVYPQFTLSDLQDESIRNLMIEDGKHQLLFFSEDDARNLEEVQSVDIYVDSTGPEVIDFSTSLETVEIFEDFFLTKMEFSFTVTEKGQCVAEVYDVGTNTVPSLGSFPISINSAPFVVNEEVINLLDGTYRVRVSCEDTLGNSAYFESEDIFVNGDLSILPIEPLGHIYADSDDVQFEIETIRSATCKFDDFETTYALTPETFDKFTEDGVFIHTALLSETGRTFSSGFYSFFVHCLFDDGELIEAKPGDILSFVIDQESPTVKVLHEVNANFEEYDELDATWEQEREVRFICTDDSTLTPGTLNFGCDNMYYCLSENPSLDLDAFRDDPNSVNCGGNPVLLKDDFDSVSVDLSLSFEENSFTYIYYVAEDEGGNRGDTKRVRTNIRNTDFTPATIIVE